YMAPWILRRLRGRSSGDGLAAKRPELAPVEDVSGAGREPDRAGPAR
ncbi:MAG: SGNH/GDSL hydrolase family protein, partial [Actinomycetota bacterium]|nr:SGNH/GDSL hydrolase family protein [Actinomycetota bacterium]